MERNDSDRQIDVASNRPQNTKFLQKGHVNLRDRVKDWQENAEFLEPPQGGKIVSTLFSACLKFFKLLLQTQSKSSREHSPRQLRRLRRICGLFQQWGTYHGVALGALDEALGDSTDLRITTIELVQGVAEVLSERKQIPIKDTTFAVPSISSWYTGRRGILLTFVELIKELVASEDERHTHLKDSHIAELLDESHIILTELEESGPLLEANDDEEESDEDGAGKSKVPSIDDMSSTLEDYVNELIQLEELFQSPTLSDSKAKFASQTLTTKEHEAHEYFIALVATRFPKAGVQLAERLGKINWSRRQRLQNVHEVPTTGYDVSNTDSKSIAEGTQFHDSGLGTSIQASTDYAASIASSISSLADGTRRRIPHLPKSAKAGEPFICNTCGQLVKFTGKRRWKHHVYTDLKPYVCVLNDCSHHSVQFSQRSLWMDHYRLEHPDLQSQICPLCLQSFKSYQSCLRHIASHLEEISLAALPTCEDSPASSDVESQCPILEPIAEPNDEHIRSSVGNIQEEQKRAASKHSDGSIDGLRHCKPCNKTFRVSKDFRRHLLTQSHGRVVGTLENCNFRCNEPGCTPYFSGRLDNYKRHLRHAHMYSESKVREVIDNA